jgi:restriction system protein
MGLVATLRALLSRARLGFAGWGPVAGPDYHHFKNLILPTSRGTSEIDHLIVSRFGLFVIELKDRSGWIYGDENEAFWTAVHFKKKFKFQNPIHQNFGHLKALEEVLGIGLRQMYSIIVFRGRCRFMTPVPQNVFFRSCSSWVARRKDVVFEDPEVQRALSVLREKAISGRFAASNHATSVQERYASTVKCPKCGGQLMERVARAGPMPGSRFLGCSNFPSCKFVRNLHAT